MQQLNQIYTTTDFCLPLFALGSLPQVDCLFRIAIAVIIRLDWRHLQGDWLGSCSFLRQFTERTTRAVSGDRSVVGSHHSYSVCPHFEPFPGIRLLWHGFAVALHNRPRLLCLSMDMDGICKEGHHGRRLPGTKDAL